MEFFIVMGGLILIPAVFVLLVYNGLVGDRNLADSAFSTIDVMLKRRWDLIPNLVAAVKGYMQHESEVLRQVSQLRAAAMQASTQRDRLAAEEELTEQLGRLRVVVESYPDLKASQNMLHLQKSLSECEEQIAAARRTFNAAVLAYNNRVQMFPHQLVAQMFGFQPRDYFGIPDAERTAPQIKDLA